MHVKKIIPSVLILLFVSFSFAQSVKHASAQHVVHYKPPVLKSHLGKYSNNSTVSLEEAKTVLALPLTISDVQNNNYSIITYQFLFRRKGMIEDEQTGKRDSSTTAVSDHFQNTPLPALWITNINEGGFVSGEEFIFFDIVVKDPQGKKFFAPDLKIRIQ